MERTAMLPPSVASSTDTEKLDGLINQTARRVANVIGDFQRDVIQGESATADGIITLRFGLRTCVLTIAPDQDREGHSVHVQTKLTDTRPTNRPEPLSSVGPSSDYITAPQQPQLKTQVTQRVISSTKRSFEDSPDISNKRLRTDDNVTALINKEDLDDLLSSLRDDIQSNTNNSINHVQSLLRRFKQEQRTDNHFNDRQCHTSRTLAPVHDSSASNGLTSDTSFPAASGNLNAKITTITNVIRQEAKLVSKQIRWVDGCGRVAADIHDEREEMWRTSSAGFHDRQRKNREEFQGKMLHESGMQSRMLKDILDEMRKIGGCAQGIKPASEACSVDSRSSTVTPPEQDSKRGWGPERGDEKEKSPT